MSKLAGAEGAIASRIDPRSSEATAIGRFGTRGEQSFTPPEGWEDALLILEPADG